MEGGREANSRKNKGLGQDYDVTIGRKVDGGRGRSKTGGSGRRSQWEEEGKEGREEAG